MWSAVGGKTDFSRPQRVNFTYLMWWRHCVGGVVVLNSNQRALFWRRRFPGKFILEFTSERLGIWRGWVRRKRLILVCLRKFSFNEIRDNQRKVVEAYAWMIAPTGFGKSLVFWSLESLFSLLTDPTLPRSSFICHKTASWFLGSFQTKLSFFLA